MDFMPSVFSPYASIECVNFWKQNDALWPAVIWTNKIFIFLPIENF